MAGDKAKPVEPADGEVSPEISPPCLHLRTKMHYVMTLVAVTGDDGSEGDAPDRFYCQRTMQGFGPDDDLVSPRLCASERTCYESSGF